MGNIITLDKEKSNACMNEINIVLKKYGMILAPSVLMTTSGMQFKIEVLPVSTNTTMNGGGNSHG